MMMRKIYIPSQEYRPKDVDLGVDSNGIDRNERKGYINVPDRHIFVDKKREGRLYTYLSDDRKVKINFSFVNITKKCVKFGALFAEI